ncbi:MAG: S8 family serine peptidase [Halobacteriovoraceae bacterium]|jgi:subtilisin-like proprotein convertase family protein|nr:S8 family serine peptidase [Halobacteriovoraceae bacterium]
MHSAKGWYLQLTLLSLLVVMASCVPSPKKATGSKTKPESFPGTVSIVPLISGNPLGTAIQDHVYTYAPTPNPIVGGLVYTVSNLPPWAEFNTGNGQIQGTPRVAGDFDNIRITAWTSDLEFTEQGPFSIHIIGDPLKEHAWHLHNMGQDAFNNSASKATVGIDINMNASILEDNTGLGIRVAVSDTGLELLHEDLADNVLANISKDYNTAPPFFGDPGVGGVSGDHGTSVAGIICARAYNEIGSRGIAPDCGLAGLNFLSSGQTTAILLDQAQGDYDIWNYSYGTSFYPTHLNTDEAYSDQLKFGVDTLRGNKGAIYIKSAGNSFRECESSFFAGFPMGGVCHSHNSMHGNVGGETPYLMVVGATNAAGVKASYSSTGSNIWISAPGGEFGVDHPAIITTDEGDCTSGYARVGATDTIFNSSNQTENSRCRYTNSFNGTSSAAPMVSGGSALVLKANPDLTWRDVKHIFASTAVKLDSSSANLEHPYGLDLSGHTYDDGWVTNGAGYSFHNHYGFGQINIDAAVAMAKTYAANSWNPQTQTNVGTLTTTVALAIPDNSATGVTSAKVVGTPIIIEAVQVRVDITHGRVGDVGLELTSPSGTKSVLLNVNNSLLMVTDFDFNAVPEFPADLDMALFQSNAFYGESAVGTWSLKVIDGLGPSTGTVWDVASSTTGTLNSWGINVYGH